MHILFFNQVFFNDARVSQKNVVGKRGEGWKIANTTLTHERSSLNANAEGTWMRLVRLMHKETVNDVPVMERPVYRERLMKLQARVQAEKVPATGRHRETEDLSLPVVEKPIP